MTAGNPYASFRHSSSGLVQAHGIRLRNMFYECISGPLARPSHKDPPKLVRSFLPLAIRVVYHHVRPLCAPSLVIQDLFGPLLPITRSQERFQMLTPERIADPWYHSNKYSEKGLKKGVANY